MTAAISQNPTAVGPPVAPAARKKVEPEARGTWWRFFAMLVITAVVLVPIIAVVLLALRPSLGSDTTASFTLDTPSTTMSAALPTTCLESRAEPSVERLVASVR